MSEVTRVNGAVTPVNGLGPATQIVSMSKSSISQSDIDAAAAAAQAENNVIAGVAGEAGDNVVYFAVQGAGVTAGVNYGATGVTAAVVCTF